MAKKNITQKQLQNLDWLDESASSELSDYKLIQENELNDILLNYAIKFKDNLLLNIKKKQITASGDLENNIIFSEPYLQNGKNTIDISLPYYAKFVDKGVQGVIDNSNAPESPYKFKNFGMSEDGRKSLKRYIKIAKKKIKAEDVSKYKTIAKQEEKFKGIADTRLNTLIYLIKAYGIKTTNFYKNAVDKSFKGLETEIADSVAVNIAVNITK